MAIYSVDVRDGMIHRMTAECHKVNKKRFYLIEARSAKQAWAKTTSAPQTNASAVCDSCRHCLCRFREDCSAAKRYSDYWICHCCAELNRRVQNLHLKAGRLTDVVSVKLAERKINRRRVKLWLMKLSESSITTPRYPTSLERV